MGVGAHVWLAPDAVRVRQVVSLSRREMAALRSSLPSPTKHKGRQMAEKMGIKTGEDLERFADKDANMRSSCVRWRLLSWRCTA